MMFPLSDERITPPAAPYIVDMIAPSLYNKLEVFSWTEEFTKCVGWHVLSPDSVNE
ncbi:hypothetical protein [Konateibacter massiliensis]|uniref:hypothetical protein n=1 Tax=Konateibacter massiliensis TaxID=2002841 RepID=UPI0015D4EEB9|nr:hypothetical protein [Konateibacter massiliensis]